MDTSYPNNVTKALRHGSYLLRITDAWAPQEGTTTQAVADGRHPRRTTREAAYGAKRIRTGLHAERLPNRREVKGVPVAMGAV